MEFNVWMMLIISSCNYLLWLMCGWLFVKLSGFVFEMISVLIDVMLCVELLLLLLLIFVLCLMYDGNVVWDMFVIVEYLNEICL